MALQKQYGGICPILVACQVEIQVLLVMRRSMQGPVCRVSRTAHLLGVSMLFSLVQPIFEQFVAQLL